MAKASREMFSLLRTQMLDAGLSTNSSTAINCPLCWKETEFENLTVEHIVPGSIGGSQTTLTCRSCNNTHGSKLDSQLSEFHKVMNGFSGNGMIRATLITAEERLAGSIQHSAEKTEFIVSVKATDPKQFASSLAKAKAGVIEPMKFSFPVCDLFKLKKAFLRIAYLSAFKTIGYSFVKTEHMQKYRTNIVDLGDPTIPIDELIIRFASFDPNWDFDFHISGCFAVGLDTGIVVIRSRYGETDMFWGVFLPNLKDGFFSEIKSASLALDTGGEFRFQ